MKPARAVGADLDLKIDVAGPRRIRASPRYRRRRRSRSRGRRSRLRGVQPQTVPRHAKQDLAESGKFAGMTSSYRHRGAIDRIPGATRGWSRAKVYPSAALGTTILTERSEGPQALRAVSEMACVPCGAEPVPGQASEMLTPVTVLVPGGVAQPSGMVASLSTTRPRLGEKPALQRNPVKKLCIWKKNWAEILIWTSTWVRFLPCFLASIPTSTFRKGSAAQIPGEASPQTDDACDALPGARAPRPRADVCATGRMPPCARRTPGA